MPIKTHTIILRKGNPFMCQALRELMKEEIQEAEEKAAQKAVDSSRIADIKNLMKKFGMDTKTIMDGMNISATDQLRYMAML